MSRSSFLERIDDVDGRLDFNQNNFLEELDPTKTYFIESDIKTWLEPTESLLNRIQNDFLRSDFSEFEKIHAEMVKAIEKRHIFEKQINLSDLPKDVKAKEFKDLKWAQTPDELLVRLERMRALQIESASKFNLEIREKSIQRIQKRQAKLEDGLLNPDPLQRERLILSDIMKAFAGAFDTHTSYYYSRRGAAVYDRRPTAPFWHRRPAAR